MASKFCAKCGETKPLGEFYKDRTRKDGLAAYCKPCCRKYDRCHYVADPEKYREYARRYYAANQEAVQKNNRRWRKANPKKAREINRRWRKANPEKCRELQRRWRKANLEKYRERIRRWAAANPEKSRENTRCWRKANPDKVRANCQRRRARQRSLPHDLTDQQWRVTLEAFGFRCAYCGELPDSINCPRYGKLVQEHLVALNKGGGYTFGNIVPSCEKCNNSKRDHNWRGWMESKAYDTDLFQSCLEHLVA